MIELLLKTGSARLYEDSGPGNQLLTMGDSKAGFFGEVTSDELFSGPELIALTRVTNPGTVVEKPTWLKFVYEGRFLFIAKSPIALSVTWDELYRCGLVFGKDNAGFNPFGGFNGEVNQITIVEKSGYKFKVRLIEDREPIEGLTSTSVKDLRIDRDTEWNKLLYRVSDSTEFDALDPKPPRPWVKYTPSQLGVQYTSVTAMLADLAGSTVATRGINTVASVHARARTFAGGWRPVLELLRGDELFKSTRLTYQTEGGLIPPGDLLGEVTPTVGFQFPPSGLAGAFEGEVVLRPYAMGYSVEGSLTPLSDPDIRTSPRLREFMPPSAVKNQVTGVQILRPANIRYESVHRLIPLSELKGLPDARLVAPGAVQTRVEMS